MSLAENCQAFRVDAAGKVVGVQLGIYAIAGSRYEVYSVRLRDEYEAQGNTVARCQVLDRNGVSTGQAVRMAWPWNGGPDFSGSALPGNPANEHFISNKYFPPNVGPLCVYVGAHNQPESDIVFGLGLPLGHHVSFDIIFRERGAVVLPPVIDPPISPDPGGDVLRRLDRIERALDALVGAWREDV